MDGEVPHAVERIGTTCEGCGTHHRVFEKLDDKPISESAMNKLEQADTIKFIQGIAMMSGGLLGVETDQEVTKDIVLSTASKTMHLSQYKGHGWVVEQEIEHEDDEDPEEVGFQLWAERSSMLAEGMKDMF